MKPSRLAAMWIVTRESVAALEDLQPLVSGQAFLLQELSQSQTHFGPNILESTTRCIRRDPSNLLLLPRSFSVAVGAKEILSAFRNCRSVKTFKSTEISWYVPID
jgi:hypothetical protein